MGLIEHIEHLSDGGCAHKCVHAAFFRPSHLSLQPFLAITPHPSFSTARKMCTPFLCTRARNFGMHFFYAHLYLSFFLSYSFHFMHTIYNPENVSFCVYISMHTESALPAAGIIFKKCTPLYVLFFFIFVCTFIYSMPAIVCILCTH